MQIVCGFRPLHTCGFRGSVIFFLRVGSMALVWTFHDVSAHRAPWDDTNLVSLAFAVWHTTNNL